MDTSTGITPVMPIGGGYGDGFGFGGGSGCGIWLFALLILLGMFNGNGGGLFGGSGNSNAIQNDINRGFDNQNLQAQTRDILAAVTNGTAQNVAATNQVYHDIVGYVGDKYSELQRDVAALAVGQANVLANQNSCCCETKQLIMQNDYNGAMRDAATNANFTAQIQSVKDMLYKDKIEALQSQVSALTTQGIVDRATAGVVRYPQNTMYAVPSPCFTGCGCGCNV